MIESKFEMYNQEASLEYPYLAESSVSSSVVLFEAPGTGCIVYKGNGAYPIGHYSTSWKEDTFTPIPLGSRVVLEQS